MHGTCTKAKVVIIGAEIYHSIR